MKADNSTQSKSEARRPSPLFYLLLAAVLFVFIQSFALLSPILLSLLLILLISLALNPAITWMRRWTGGRKRAAGLLVLAFVGVMGLTGWAFTVPMKESVTKFTEQLPQYWERLQKPLIKLEQQAENTKEKLEKEVTTEIAREKAASGELDVEQAAAAAARAVALHNPESEKESEEEESEKEKEKDKESALGSISSSLAQMFEGLLGRFTSMAFNGAQILIVLVTVFFGVIFTLMDPRPIFWGIFSVVPDRQHDQALAIMRRIGDFVPRWAGATLLGMMTIGSLVFLLMWPFFGFMDALMLGLIAGIFAAVPFLGPILSAVPALLLAFGEGGMTPLWVLLVYLGIQAVEGNVITPMIMAQGMRLHPLAVIFSMLLCVAAFGVLGVLVAAPLVAIVGILHDEIYRKRFLPEATDAQLDRLSRLALHEKVSPD